tara:strand:- start:684 stop:1067 length:384 start_codon:yes stop_codon:yes gene_type:complete
VISPEQIADISGVQPSDSHQTGDSFGRVRKGIQKSNYWAINQRIEGDDTIADCTDWFSDGLIKLLGQVSSDFKSRIIALDSEACVICWVGLFGIQDQGGLNIRSDASKMLGEYDLELVFDMYIDNES